MITTRFLLLTAFITTLTVADRASTQASRTQPRPLRVEDLFTVESLKGQALSPDGEWVALVIERTQGEGEVYQRDFLNGNDHADVWLVSSRGGNRRNLTNGAADASGFWNAVWSPDGARLAMMSTKGGPRGGDNVRLWVWERTTGRLTRVSRRPLDLGAVVDAPAAGASAGDGFSNVPFAWLGPTTLLFAALPDSMTSIRYAIEHQTQRIASRAWPDAERGRVVTVSVLETGAPARADRPRLGTLVRAELSGASDAARETVVTTLSIDGQQRRVFVSPTLARAAVVEWLHGAPPTPDTLLNLTARHGRTRLGIVSLDGRAAAPVWWVDSLPPLPDGVAWSPDGSRLAVASAGKGGSARTFVLSPGTSQAIAVGGDRVTVSRVAWSDDRTLLAYGTPRALAGGAPPPASPRPAPPAAGWWRVGPGDSSVALTPGRRQVGTSLVRLGPLVVALADSDLYAVDPGGAAQRNLTAQFEPAIASLAWPLATRPAPNGVPAIVIETTAAAGKRLYRVTQAGDRLELVELTKPQPRVRLASYLPSRGLALLTTAGEPFPLASDGPRLWAADVPATGAPSAASRELLSLNRHLDAIVEPERRFITYRGLEGDSLIADVLLPVGYQPGKRYPLVVHVYAGSVTRDTLDPRLRYPKNSGRPLNFQLLAAHGYVVMTPSMPLSPDGTAKDPYMELPKGVLPAVDKLVDLGIADPARVGVIGQSFGGFSTYGLITLTNRFKAAVSLAGIANWFSLYGAFDPRSRYEEDPQDFFAPGLLETGQVSLGATPWRDLWKYLRNSPIYFFDRVNTPLLIIQGDVDYVTMAQGEEAFTALQRLGKRGQFVRYWGEGHVLNSPANVRDMWNRIFAWFDEHLAAPAPAKTASGGQE